MVHRDMESTKRCLFPPETDTEESNHSLGTEEMGNCEHDDDDNPEDIMKEQRGSPTSVSGYPLHISKEETITMSDHGAEVSIDFSRISLSTPGKSNGRIPFRRANSLLDYTSPSPTKSMSSSDEDTTTLNTTDSPFNNTVEENECDDSQIQLQKSIVFCLGDTEAYDSSSAGCNGWHTWSYCGSDDTKHASPFKRTNPKNRAFSIEARRSRLQKLHQNQSPFNGSPAKASRATNMLNRSRSFSILDHGPAIVRLSKEENQRTIGFTNVFQLCTLPENSITESPTILQRFPNHWGEDDCYDSDPEEFTRIRGKSTPRSTKKRGSNYSYPRQVVPSPTGKFEDAFNEDTFVTIAQEFVNTTFTLIFHSSSPVAVHAWIERGQTINQALTQPKWMWKPKPCSNSNGNQNEEMLGIQAVDLLNITRVLKVDQIDRCRNPFAKPSNCFMTKTLCGEELIFETINSSERDRLVFGMKMVIARFGAKIIGQDESVYEEFFATSEPVPGGACVSSVIHRYQEV